MTVYNFFTHWGKVTQICVSKLGHHTFRWWLVAGSASSHYLNQCWLIGNNWTIVNIFRWNFNQNTILFSIKYIKKYCHLSLDVLVKYDMSIESNPRLNKINSQNVTVSYPQCTIQNRNVYISVLNGALWGMGQVQCEIGLFQMKCVTSVEVVHPVGYVTSARNSNYFVTTVMKCGTDTTVVEYIGETDSEYQSLWITDILHNA